jgi:hypothetical protein
MNTYNYNTITAKEKYKMMSPFIVVKKDIWFDDYIKLNH